MAPSAEEITSSDASASTHHQVYHKSDYEVSSSSPQKGNEAGNLHPNIFHPSLVLRNRDESPPDPEELGLEEELPGWHGYVEWEKYPERKQMVKEYMKKFAFPGVSLLFSFSFVVEFFLFALSLVPGISDSEISKYGAFDRWIAY